MTYLADLHLHSHYARATSKELTLENLAHWAKLKGVDLLSSGDFTHPAWFEETRAKLREAGDGVYEYLGAKFILGTEVNCVGQQGGRGRRVHLLLFAPSLDVAERLNAALAPFGVLAGDGRLTLSMLPRDLALLLHGLDPRCFMVPAHLWTPWFGLYGSKSGFDSLEECFGDAAGLIFAIETGLSSDPAMCWRVPSLDRVAIVSFSDAHSLPKMGRELTAVEGEPSYSGLVESLRKQRIAYTIEFFPEEGQYHFSGHRKCRVSLSPEEVRRQGERCPKCGRRMTLGVAQRVEELGGSNVKTWRDEKGFIRGGVGRPPFRTFVGLRQIIAEAKGVGVDSKAAQKEYYRVVSEMGNEVSVLMEAGIADIARMAGERVAEGVGRVRSGSIAIVPGYDGEYGRVSIWPETQGKLVPDS